VFGRQKVRQIDHLAFVSDLKDENWHGWQKNVTATVDLIRAMTPPGSRVLDPCLGSGTTGVAAIESGCSFVGIDLDGSAVKTARARLAEAERRLGPALERPRVA
jgi:site-specific DNA-methyltransferase (adenine-specific)